MDPSSDFSKDITGIIGLSSNLTLSFVRSVLIVFHNMDDVWFPSASMRHTANCQNGDQFLSLGGLSGRNVSMRDRKCMVDTPSGVVL